MKILFTIMLSIFTMIASMQSIAQVTHGKTAYEKKHGNWSSFVVYTDKEARTRAITYSTDGYMSMSVDAHQPDCKLSISFLIPYDKPLESNLDRKILITTRIDSKDVHYLNSNYNGVMGDTMAFITINPTPDFYEIINELKVGVTARTRLEHANGDQIGTVSFPLNGFTAALDRVISLCKIGTSSQEKPQPAPPPPPKNETLPRHPDAIKL